MFFLPQGSRWTKYVAHPKIRRPKPCLLMFASLVTVSWLLIWILSEVVDPCFNHYHKFMQNIFSYVETVSNMLWIVNASLTLIDCEQTVHPLWTHLSHWRIFMKNGEYTAFWYPRLLLSQASSVYDRPKQVCAVFWCFPEPMPNLGDLSVRHHVCHYDNI